MNDIFLFLQKCDLANYADGSTMYTSDKRVSTIIDSLSRECTILSKWFYNNFMVLNPGKCSFMLLGVDNSLQTNLVCGDEILKNTKQDRSNNKLNFATHLLKKLIFSSFIKLQFTYCPLIWMFYTKRSLRTINNIHERCLRLLQQNHISEFEKFK